MESLYLPFLTRLPPNAHILDAGCGSGRDTKAFIHKGYKVTAIDESPEMVRVASLFTNHPCKTLSFQEMIFENKFDGIWACASILHVPKNEMNGVINKFIRALKYKGIIYISLKEGRGEKLSEDGRFFNYYSIRSFKEVINCFHEISLLSSWKTNTVSRTGDPIPWLNFLIKKDNENDNDRKRRCSSKRSK